MLPAAGRAARGSQKATIARLIHERKTDDNFGVVVEELQTRSHELSPEQRANVYESLYEYKKLETVPPQLSEDLFAATSAAFQAWKVARQNNDWKSFEPELARVVELLRQKARLVQQALGLRTPYDALLSDYDRFLTTVDVEQMFEAIVPVLSDATRKVREKVAAGKDSSDASAADSSSTFDVEAQKRLCRHVVTETMGLDASKIRFDDSVHPFCAGVHPTDVRITSRYSAEDYTEGLKASIHEGGHALYEQGRPVPKDGPLPVSKARSMSVHESQSLFWERMVGATRPFAKHLKAIGPALLPALEHRSEAQIYADMNRVKFPSKIRTEADELQYPFHVYIRFLLEKRLINEDLPVADIPAIWNELTKQYLGFVPDKDADGCLQDVHWSVGFFGYFPTYVLGAIYAHHYSCHLRSSSDDLFTTTDRFDSAVASGNVGPIAQWLRDNLHQLGSTHPSSHETVVKSTRGKQPDFSRYAADLREKYFDLYGIEDHHVDGGDKKVESDR
eukprot:GHVU01074439.1.p1 GENE.GHVU01074439.1~~GHVU01074439.1.p1  ORF type:complete len:505 (+),score=127.78 GHVU01074439.1:564-2078(+)